MPHELYTVKTQSGQEVVLPSVTEVIGILGSPALMRWSNWLGKTQRSYDQFMDERAIRGTVVHSLMANLIDPKGHPMENYQLTRENLKAVMDIEHYAREWAKDVKFKPKLIEQPILAPQLGYAGCPDYFGTIEFKKSKVKYTDALVDWKTSKKPRDKQFLQLGGYSQLLKSKGFKPKHFIIVNLLTNREPLVTVRSDYDELLACEEAFNYLLHFYLLWKEKGYT